MPSHYAHWYFGGLVRKALPAPLAELVESQPEPFLAGLQGPDVLFHYHPLRTNPVKREGSAIHDRSGLRFFEAARETLKAADTPAARSYLAGFLCHYMLDTACHPLVEEGMAASGASHSSVETDLDRRPATRQLLYSLCRYVASPDFQPAAEVAAYELDAVFTPKTEAGGDGAEDAATRQLLNR